jgi:hypothetical protein
MHRRLLMEILKERDYPDDPIREHNIKTDRTEERDGYGLYSCGFGSGQAVGFCEHGNETSGSIKCGEFVDWLGNFQLLNKKSAPWS